MTIHRFKLVVGSAAILVLVLFAARGIFTNPGAENQAVASASAHINSKTILANQLQYFSQTGKQVTIKPGHRYTLLSHSGAGCVTQMWFAGHWKHIAQTEIRVYVDGQTKPSIAMQLGLGHGMGLPTRQPWGTGRIGQTANQGGMYDTYQIPFGTSIRITAELAPKVKSPQLFWWIIHGTSGPLPVVIHGVVLPSAARLHLYKVTKFKASPLQFFNLCNIKGHGELLEVAMDAASEGNPNFMEGCIRAYSTGSNDTTFLSSGLEDFFTGSGYFCTGTFHNPLGGCTYLSPSHQQFSAYRFFTRDPIFFQHGLRLVCRDGERLKGTVYGNPQAATYSTYVWVYQW